MNVPKYVQKKMSFRERVRVFLLKRKLFRVSKKFEKYVLMSHKYENLLFNYDTELYDIIQKLKIKYA